MQAFPPNGPPRVAVLAHGQVSVPLALLAVELFQRARILGDQEGIEAHLVGDHEVGNELWTLRPASWEGPWDLVVVPPMGPGFTGSLEALDREIDWLGAQARSGARIASACLGAYLVGAAGLLDGRDATTHWLWAGAARERFPRVRWETDQMICDTGSVVTAAGYLTLIDLVLHIVETGPGRGLAQTLARRILADTGRQKQSVYAQTLTQGIQDPAFVEFDRWVERRLAGPLTVEEMASQVAMSPRNFFRRFRDVYGMTPLRYLQRKRIETAQGLLRNEEVSLETVLARVGLSDHHSFRKVFQRELGLTPADYRRKFRPQ
jgi:transcriptional regulator GlxA family with amidase domain